MNISRERFEERQQSIIINDVEYDVPKRTQAVQDKLTAVQKSKNITEFERYYKSIECILGDKYTREIFSLGKDENLDYMASVVIGVLEVYNYSKNEIDNAKYNEMVEKIKPMTDAVGALEYVK